MNKCGVGGKFGIVRACVCMYGVCVSVCMGCGKLCCRGGGVEFECLLCFVFVFVVCFEFVDKLGFGGSLPLLLSCFVLSFFLAFFFFLSFLSLSTLKSHSSSLPPPPPLSIPP